MRRLFLLLLTGALLLSGCAGSSSGATESTTATETSVETTAAVQIPTEPADPLREFLDSLTPEQKVGQLFIVCPELLYGAEGAVTEMTDGLADSLSRYPVGGIILFSDNIVSPEQLLTLNRSLSALSRIPLFLSVDEEGGAVARLARNPAFQLPTYQNAAAVGASGNPQDAWAMGSTIGQYLSEYGFNLNFAPVADVNTNPRNPVIGSRAFSSDAAIAASMAAAFTGGLNQQGIIGTYKHFPGHGDTAEDSHSCLAVNGKTREELESCEWIPFREAGIADLVMVGHIALPQITGDMTPATLSRQIVTELLKGELGFTGLVVTDSMQMGAITGSFSSGDAAVAALTAGCDLILMPEDLPEAFDAVLAALEDGTLSMEWLDETVYRILAFKLLHGILILP